MAGKNLTKKPLVEALLEIKWILESKEGVAPPFDPSFELLPGKFHEALRNQYPEVENLPITLVPSEITAYQVRHRFRVSKNGWPVVQVGPGVATFNDTEGYTWESFKAGALEMVSALKKARPPDVFPPLKGLLLRYINGCRFDYQKSSLLDFLDKKMKVKVSLPQGVIDNGAPARPEALNVALSYPIATPKATLQVRFATGKLKEEEALIWEIWCSSENPGFSMGDAAFANWLEGAHQAAEKCFFKLIEGELQKEFE